MVPGAMSWKLLATALMISRGMTNCPPGMSPMREARATLHESWKVTMRSSFFSLSNLQRAALDQVVGELADVLRQRVARIEAVERARSACSRSCRPRARRGRTRPRRCA